MTTLLNIDQNEINKFNALAQDWWNLNGSSKALHDINPLRLKFINNRINVAQKKVIDVGCGGGILSEGMAKLGADVTGIDMSEAGIAVARTHAQSQGLTIRYEQIPVETIAIQQAGQFDAVTCMELLEHVPDPAAIITACAQLVKPNGHVFFSTINRNPKSYLFAILGAEYLLKLIPKGTHDYSKFIRPAELNNWVRAADLQIQEMIGMTYNPLTRIYQLTSRIDVNYLVCCVKS